MKPNPESFNRHAWRPLTETVGGKLRRVGSACIACGHRVYGWGGFIGLCTGA